MKDTTTRRIVTPPPGNVAAANGNKQLTILPNPNNGIFRVKVPAGKTQLVITNINGQVVQQVATERQGEYDFDMTGQPKGVYLLHVTNGETTMTEKLVVQ